MKVHVQGGRSDARRSDSLVETAPRLFWDLILLCLSQLGGDMTHSGVVSNGVCFQSFEGTPLTGWEVEFLTLQCLYWNQHGSLSPWWWGRGRGRGKGGCVLYP